MKNEFKITEAEKNLLCFLRTRKPFEIVRIRYNKEAKVEYYLVNTEQKLVIDDLGISEVAIKERELSTG